MNDYNTNILKLTCSCPDWKETRQQYKLNDPRRLCKHIINKLDIEKLPSEISSFKESIKYFQENERGFRTDFKKIVVLPKNNIIILYDYDWIDVFDHFGNRYGYLNNSNSDVIYWAKNKKPNGYEEVESYFKKIFTTIPKKLKDNEKYHLIKYIKQIIPSKINVDFTIEDDQYLPSPDGIYYCLWENNSEYNEVDEVRNIIVRKNEILIEMYLGEIFTYDRHLIDKEVSQIEISEMTQNKYIDNETLFYLLRKEYKISRDIELQKYSTLANLLKEEHSNIKTITFNKILKQLNMLKKVSTINENKWIIIENGLKYGMNLMNDSKSRQNNIPDWYEIQTYHSEKKKFVLIKPNSFTKTTSVLWLKSNFQELYKLVISQIENKKPISNKQKEREKWLRHITCPSCGENTNIHKKDKRTRRAGYTIQRFYCNECNSMFQIDFNELEKSIQEYQEKNSIL